MSKPSGQAAGRPLPRNEEEGNRLNGDLTTTKNNNNNNNKNKNNTSKIKRQQTLLQYMSPSENQQVAGDPSSMETTASKDTCTALLHNDTVYGHTHRSGLEIVRENLFRVYYNNVNGLSTRDGGHDLSNFTQVIASKECAVVAITEPNRNFERPAVVSEYFQAMRNVSSHHQGAVSSAHLGWKSDYQPGGTAISVRNKWATRFLAKGSDSLGRWSYISLSGKGTSIVTFIVAYRVCDGASETPLSARTVRAQQEWMYADRGHNNNNTDLREQCLSDLADLVNQLKSAGHDIVLSMDANESNDCATSKVAQFLHQTELADVHGSLLDKDCLPATKQKLIIFLLLNGSSPLYVPAASCHCKTVICRIIVRWLWILNLWAYLERKPRQLCPLRRGY